MGDLPWSGDMKGCIVVFVDVIMATDPVSKQFTQLIALTLKCTNMSCRYSISIQKHQLTVYKSRCISSSA